MNDDYLWDRSGPPDPEIERLEKSLAPLRYRHRADIVRAASTRPRLAWAAVAASVLCGHRRLAVPGASGNHDRLADRAARRFGAEPETDRPSSTCPLRAGQTLRTAGRFPADTTRRRSRQHRSGSGFGNRAPPATRQVQAESRQTARIHLGAARTVCSGYSLVARHRPGVRVHDQCRSGGRRAPEGCDGLGGVSVRWARVFIPAGAQCVTRKRRVREFPTMKIRRHRWRNPSEFRTGRPRLAAGHPGRGAPARRAHAMAPVDARPRRRSVRRLRSLRAARAVPPEVKREAVVRKDRRRHRSLLGCAEPRKYRLVARLGTQVVELGCGSLLGGHPETSIRSPPPSASPACSASGVIPAQCGVITTFEAW